MEKGKTDQFIELDVKKLKHIEAERKRFLTSVMQEVPDMHFMRCPRCSRHLEEKTITDISIIMCSQCKGIWIGTESLAKVLSLPRDMADNFLNHAIK
jgi:hypothetical protein